MSRTPREISGLVRQMVAGERTVNLTTGALTKVALSGAALQPKGQIFVKF